MTDKITSTEQTVPPEIQEQYEHEPLYCTECEFPVSVTRNRDDQQQMRFECSCTVRAPSAAFPGRWSF